MQLTFFISSTLTGTPLSVELNFSASLMNCLPASLNDFKSSLRYCAENERVGLRTSKVTANAKMNFSIFLVELSPSEFFSRVMRLVVLWIR